MSGFLDGILQLLQSEDVAHRLSEAISKKAAETGRNELYDLANTMADDEPLAISLLEAVESAAREKAANEPFCSLLY